MSASWKLLPVVLVMLASADLAAPLALPAEYQPGEDPLDLAIPLDPMGLAVTFDDLPAFDDPLPALGPMDVAARVIGALRERHLRGVYGFSNGAPIERDRGLLEVLRTWVAAGHYLANHTFSHLDLTATTAEAYIADIERMDRLIRSVSGNPPALKGFRYALFREGETPAKRDRVRAYLARNGYQIVPGTVGYADWAWAKAYRRCDASHDTARLSWLREQVIAAARRGLRRAQQLARLVVGRDIKHILVLHLSAFTALVLPDVLDAMKADGAAFVELGLALRDPVYAVNPNLPLSAGMDFLEQLATMKRIKDPYRETRYTVESLEALCRRAAP
jgi:peptidoglycan/xylan/chitin deacetylase (PgdA/CDA1 family)